MQTHPMTRTEFLAEIAHRSMSETGMLCSVQILPGRVVSYLGRNLPTWEDRIAYLIHAQRAARADCVATQ